MKVLYILVGPKGAGKTYIGTVVDRLTEVHFLRVEPLWLALDEGQDGWRVEEEAVDAAFVEHDRVLIETLGVGHGFVAMLARFRERYRVKLIKVEADLGECLRRVQGRARADHMPVSDEQVMAYNAIAADVTYDWDAVIDNNGPATQEAILAAFHSAV